jgi:hypothetical protein
MPLDATRKTHAAPVTVWTIYREPSDHPGRGVLRAHDVFPGIRMQSHDFCFVAETLEEVRAKVPPGTSCVGRASEDDPVIHESWIVETTELLRH